MNAQYLHISFGWSGPPKIKQLEPTFDLALDWLRYAGNCWIVYTTSSPAKWYERLKPHMSSADVMFICKLDITVRHGWLPKQSWEWLQKKR